MKNNFRIMEKFKVKYYAGTYQGTREVYAEDGEEAISMVRAKIRREMTLPMYTDGYELV